MLYLAGCDQFADWIAHGRKFLLVFSHNVAAVHSSIIVKIPGESIQMPDVLVIDLIEREREQILIVSLELETTVRCKNLIVTF